MQKSVYESIKNADEMEIKKEFANIMDIIIETNISDKEKIAEITKKFAPYLNIYK